MPSGLRPAKPAKSYRTFFVVQPTMFVRSCVFLCWCKHPT